VRFSEFLRTTVLLSAASATLLGVMTLSAADATSDDLVVPVAAAWWLLAALAGAWAGRRADASPPIARLLATARTRASLPDVQPGRVLINRLWPLLVCTLGAAALGFVLPQVPAIAAGFAIIPAMAWRRQGSAVRAIEERDGARFYVERTSPLQPIRLVRTPGFRSNLLEMNGASRPTAGRRA
jgi:hypothetical protein